MKIVIFNGIAEIKKCLTSKSKNFIKIILYSMFCKNALTSYLYKLYNISSKREKKKRDKKLLKQKFAYRIQG